MWYVAEAKNNARNLRLEETRWQCGLRVRHLNQYIFRYAKRLKNLLDDLKDFGAGDGNRLDTPFKHAPYEGSIHEEIREIRETIAWCRARTKPGRPEQEAQRCAREAMEWDKIAETWERTEENKLTPKTPNGNKKQQGRLFE